MKKRYIIIMIGQTIIILLTFVYAFMQKLEADVQHAKSIAAQIEAEENFKEAERQRAIAIANEIKAKELELTLIRCNEKK